MYVQCPKDGYIRIQRMTQLSFFQTNNADLALFGSLGQGLRSQGLGLQQAVSFVLMLCMHALL